MDIPGFSIDHMLEFSKLAMGWVVELAGWDHLEETVAAI